MSVDFISRQPALGIYWTVCVLISNLIFNKYPKLIPNINEELGNI